MPDLILTHSRADTLPPVLPRRRATARRTAGAREADSTTAAALRRDRTFAERRPDRFSPFTLSALGWREVAAAWMVMVVLVAGLTTWISLRVPHDVSRIETPLRISTPTPAGTCSERDYANERC
jgi:hypothetical protein